MPVGVGAGLGTPRRYPGHLAGTNQGNVGDAVPAGAGEIGVAGVVGMVRLRTPVQYPVAWQGHTRAMLGMPVRVGAGESWLPAPPG